MIRKW